MIRSIAIVVLPLALVAATTAPSTAPSTGPTVSVADGVYNAAQLERGQKLYNSLCARCHGDTLMGNDDAPQLTDKVFLEKWEGKTVASLVTYTQKEMPTDGPGKISRKQCTDITAFVLSGNGFPSGQSELAPEADAQEKILIKAKK